MLHLKKSGRDICFTSHNGYDAIVCRCDSREQARDIAGFINWAMPHEPSFGVAGLVYTNRQRAMVAMQLRDNYGTIL